MCSDNPNLPKEANKAKCIAVACFVVSMQFHRKLYTNLVHKGVHKRVLAFTSEVEAPTELHPTDVC